MQEVLKFAIGIFVLFLGIPIGNFLAKNTKEELKTGNKWFKRTAISSLIAALVGLIIGNDVLLFTCSFIAIVTSRSLQSSKKPGKQRKGK